MLPMEPLSPKSRCTPQKRVIFVCVGNSCRSPMAEGFVRHYAQKMGLHLEVSSAGTRPEGTVNPRAVEAMREVGIDISQHRPRRISPEELLEYDYVITMGCADRGICPASFPGISRDWGIEDPFGKPMDVYRRVRDEIREQVLALLEEIREHG